MRSAFYNPVRLIFSSAFHEGANVKLSETQWVDIPKQQRALTLLNQTTVLQRVKLLSEGDGGSAAVVGPRPVSPTSRSSSSGDEYLRGWNYQRFAAIRFLSALAYPFRPVTLLQYKPILVMGLVVIVPTRGHSRIVQID